jgi:glutathione peroxidase-family protein
MIHNELKPEHKIVILKVRFQWHFIQFLISQIGRRIFLFKPKF